MPAAIPILVAVTAASSIYSAVDSNQQRQHAKGAAEAQKTSIDAEIASQKKDDQAAKSAKATNASANQKAAIAAIQSSMRNEGGMGGTILTGGSGAGPAPTQQKQLLGT